MSDVEAGLRQAVPAAPHLRLELSSLGTFGGRRAPRVLWASLGGQIDGLLVLAERVDAALQARGLPREKRPLAPYLTLARVPESFPAGGAPVLQSAIEHMAKPDLPTFEPSSVSLMLSHLGRGGAHYERLASFPSPSI